MQRKRARKLPGLSPRAIQSTSFGGGGTGTTPSMVGTPVVNDVPVTNTAAPTAPSTVINLTLDPNGIYTGNAVRDFLAAMQEELDDGMVLNVNAT